MTTLLWDAPALTVPVGDDDHVLGPRTAPLTLVEYGDYECPYCGAAFPEVEQLLELLGDELRFGYRHFPLAQIHPHAGIAAEAAEAAGAQDRFWEMHALLYGDQQRLEFPDLVDRAVQLELNVSEFRQDLETHRHAPTVRAHFMSGVRSGVNGTPTFFVNGVRHNGGYDVASLLAALRGSL